MDISRKTPMVITDDCSVDVYIRERKMLSDIDLIGNLKLLWEQQYLLDHLHHPDPDVQDHTSLALTISEREEGIHSYLQILKTEHSLQYDALYIFNTVSEPLRNTLFWCYCTTVETSDSTYAPSAEENRIPLLR
jgi:hypothetical protein